jgi:S1-C subfamily serine protease
MNFLKKIFKIKIRLITAVLLASAVIALPPLHSKLFRSFIGSSVFIVKDVNEQKGSGSGFIVKNSKGKRLFVTNNHVCEGVEEKNGILAQSDILSSDKFILKVLLKDPAVDICIAEPPSYGRGLSISLNLEKGDTVHVLGHPIGFPLHKTSGEAIAPLKLRMMKGQFPFSLEIVEYDAWQISAATSPGNSGSPVLDNLGRVVGILFAGSNVNSYTSFIIPAEKLHAIIEGM